MATELTPSNVQDLMKRCLVGGEDKVTDKSIKVEGLVHNYMFDDQQIANHKDVIKELLMQLPKEFRKSSGGGYSFLCACNDIHGHQWGEHIDMESLFCLGIAAGLCEYLLPRDIWPALPGGVPYIVFNDDV